MLAQEKLKVTDIRVFDHLTQKTTDRCQMDCPQLILATPEGCKCACNDQFAYNPTKKLCEDNLKPKLSKICLKGKREMSFFRCK